MSSLVDILFQKLEEKSKFILNRSSEKEIEGLSEESDLEGEFKLPELEDCDVESEAELLDMPVGLDMPVELDLVSLLNATQLLDASVSQEPVFSEVGLEDPVIELITHMIDELLEFEEEDVQLVSLGLLEDMPLELEFHEGENLEIESVSLIQVVLPEQSEPRIFVAVRLKEPEELQESEVKPQLALVPATISEDGELILDEGEVSLIDPATDEPELVLQALAYFEKSKAKGEPEGPVQVVTTPQDVKHAAVPAPQDVRHTVAPAPRVENKDLKENQQALSKSSDKPAVKKLAVRLKAPIIVKKPVEQQSSSRVADLSKKPSLEPVLEAARPAEPSIIISKTQEVEETPTVTPSQESAPIDSSFLEVAEEVLPIPVVNERLGPKESKQRLDGPAMRTINYNAPKDQAVILKKRVGEPIPKQGTSTPEAASIKAPDLEVLPETYAPSGKSVALPIPAEAISAAVERSLSPSTAQEAGSSSSSDRTLMETLSQRSSSSSSNAASPRTSMNMGGDQGQNQRNDENSQQKDRQPKHAQVSIEPEVVKTDSPTQRINEFLNYGTRGEVIPAILKHMERFRQSGRTSVNIPLKGDGDSEVSMNMRLVGNKIIVSFQGESEEFQESITNVWNDLRQRAANKGITLEDLAFSQRVRQQQQLRQNQFTNSRIHQLA